MDHHAGREGREVDMRRTSGIMYNQDCASILGVLGNLLWIRCRRCGMQYNIKTESGQALELVYPIQ